MSRVSHGIKTLVRNFEELVCGTFLVTMITLVILNVFLRYIFSYSITWSEEVATICFVWCVFMGASATYKHKMDLGIDLLIKQAPLAIENTIRFATLVLLLALNAYIFYMAIVFTHIAWGKPTAVLGVSSAVFNSALIVSFGLITVHTLRFLAADIKVFLNKESA